MRATPPSVDLTVALFAAAVGDENRRARVVAIQFAVTKLAIVGPAEIELDVDDHARESVADFIVNTSRHEANNQVRDGRRDDADVFSVGGGARMRKRLCGGH